MINHILNKRNWSVSAILFFALFNLAFGPVVAKKVREGNKLFHEQKFDDALTKYTDAQLEQPESPQIYFNIADTLYEQRKYNEAEQLFVKAMPQSDTALESKIYYNIGNCKYRQGQLRESIDYYKKAVELDPLDEDAKYNIEFVERKIKEMLSKQQERMDQKQQEQQQDSRSEAETPSSSQSDKEQEQEQQGQRSEAESRQIGEGQSKEEKEGEEKDETKAAQEKQHENNRSEAETPRSSKNDEGPQARPTELSKEETEALLRMAAEEERNAQQPKEKQTGSNYYPKVDKPW